MHSTSSCSCSHLTPPQSLKPGHICPFSSPGPSSLHGSRKSRKLAHATVSLPVLLHAPTLRAHAPSGHQARTCGLLFLPLDNAVYSCMSTQPLLLSQLMTAWNSPKPPRHLITTRLLEDTSATRSLAAFCTYKPHPAHNVQSPRAMHRTWPLTASRMLARHNQLASPIFYPHFASLEGLRSRL